MYIYSTKDLAMQVIDRRKQLRLTQAEVADRVGLKQKTISAFEKNPESCKISTLFLILSAVYLDVNLMPKDRKNTEWKHEW